MNRNTLSLALIVAGLLMVAIGLYEFFTDRSAAMLPLAAAAGLLAAGAALRRKARGGRP